MFTRLLQLAVVLFTFLSCMGTAHAAQYALLVGVSNYPNLTKLPGAANDVKLMQALLERKGFKPENIRVVADGVAGGEQPTRSHILKALDQLLSKAEEGDYVYLHFSLHGSQQYAPPGVITPNGLSEIILPIDVGHAQTSRGQVPNAIADYELISYLDRFLAKGAFVWGVFDACHSATLMRGENDFTYRSVSPREFGLEWNDGQDMRTATRGGPAVVPSSTRHPKAKGGFVSFYGAQTNQKAPEGYMPLNLPDGDSSRVRHGVLTYTLAEAMEGFAGGSFRQLSQYIQQRYLTLNLLDKVSPAFSGDSLDRDVFTPRHEAGIRQWPLVLIGNGASIPAGSLQQIARGAKLLVLPSAVAEESQALGWAEAIEVQPLASELRLSKDKGGARLDPGALPRGAVARLVNPGASMLLRVSVAQPGSGEDRRLQAIVAALKANPPQGMRIAWMKPARPHDIELHLRDGRIWLKPAGLPLVTQGKSITPSIELSKSGTIDISSIAEALGRTAKAVNVVRLANTLAATDVDAGRFKLTATLKPRRTGKDETLTPASHVEEGDEICIDAANAGFFPIDLTILLVDSAFGIAPLYPSEGALNRLQPHDRIPICFAVAAPFGVDRLLVFAAPVRQDTPKTDLSFLAQSSPVRGAMQVSDLEQLFEEAAFGSGAMPPDIRTRGGSASPAALLSKTVVKVMQWTSRAAEAATEDKP